MSVEDLDPTTDLRGLLRLLRTGTLCTLTRGAHGGIAFTIRPGTPRMRFFPALPSGGEVDTTGAGDAFLASLLAARVAPVLVGRQPHLPAALKFAAAVAAVHVGGLGLAGVPTLSQVRDVLRRSGPG